MVEEGHFLPWLGGLAVNDMHISNHLAQWCGIILAVTVAIVHYMCDNGRNFVRDEGWINSHVT